MAYATVDELAAALRNPALATSQTAALQACLDAAALEINHTIDRPPEAITPAAVYLFDTATQAADPGPGYLRWDKQSAAAVQHLYLDVLDADGIDRTSGLTQGL